MQCARLSPASAAPFLRSPSTLFASVPPSHVPTFRRSLSPRAYHMLPCGNIKHFTLAADDIHAYLQMCEILLHLLFQQSTSIHFHLPLRLLLLLDLLIQRSGKILTYHSVALSISFVEVIYCWRRITKYKLYMSVSVNVCLCA